MKKVFYSLLVLTGIFVAVSFTSCKKKTTSSADPISSTATIKGKIQADLDATNTTLELAPAGTRIIAVINAADLIENPQSGVTYGNIEYSTTVDASGEYALTVAAGTKPVTVTIKCDDFVYSKVITGAAPVRTIYAGPTSGTVVYKNQIKWVDMTY